MSETLSAPVQQAERIKLIDCIRGIALLGILLMNSMAQSGPHQFYDKMDIRQSLTGPNFYAWVIECLFFEGTMRGLFSILFGAGTLLFLTKLIKKKTGLEPADIYYRRMLWLLVFGLINAFVFLWPGDILYPYAICGLLLFPFRNLSPKVLLIVAFAFLLIGTYRENSDLYKAKNTISAGRAAEIKEKNKVKLSGSEEKDLHEYHGYKERNSSQGIVNAAIEENKNVQRKSYGQLFKFFLGINMMIESVVFYKNYWWDILLFFFVGMALFKNGFLQGEKKSSVYVIIAVIGIFSGLALNYFYYKLQYNVKFDQVNFNDKWLFSYYQIRRLLQTVGYLSLLIFLYKIIPLQKVLNIFAPVGQMAFTNYLSQSIITGIIFHGFDLFGNLQRYQVYYIVVAIWIFQILFSNIWLRFFRFGPFEWLWRSLTYWHKQPMKRQARVSTEKENIEIANPVVI